MKIVITGTSRGIGNELAQHFIYEGHEVVGCSRGASTIDHKFYKHYELNVNDEQKIVAMLKDIGTVDVLINNAGIASMNHLISTPYSTLQNVFQTNVYGSFLFLRESAKQMRRGGKGRIINLTTVAKPLELEGELVYAASKAAVETMTKIAAKELAGWNITVNAVGPTPVPTDLIKNVPQEKMQALLQRQAIKRFGRFDDVINVIKFFMSPYSDFVTGQVIYLGGV
jgi:3-oxoacyl-[acyl-carrier protein] reductase